MTAIQLNSDFQLLLGWISKMIFVKKATEGIFSGLSDSDCLNRDEQISVFGGLCSLPYLPKSNLTFPCASTKPLTLPVLSSTN
jgi:hypothetical protein